MDPETYSNGMYPTIFDMEAAASDELKTVISEMETTSDIVASAPMVESSNGTSHTYTREAEFKNTAKDAHLTEGWYSSKDGRSKDFEAYIGRVIDERSFEQLESSHTSDKGYASRALGLRNMSRSLIEKISENLIYGGHDALGKQAMGLTTYLEDIYTFNDVMRSISKGKLPFKSDDSCIAFDNQIGLSTSDSSTVTTKKSEDVWASIYGIAWGVNQTYTIYPKNRGLAGYEFTWHNDQKVDYTDPMDGIKKHTYEDLLSAEAFYGLVVANRFSAVGLRNIYLDHEKTEDQMLEMANVRRNLINLWMIYSKGKLDTNMAFYCNDVLFSQMEQFIGTQVLQVSTTPEQNQGYVVNRVHRLRVTNNIELVTDPAIKMDEPFIS